MLIRIALPALLVASVVARPAPQDLLNRELLRSYFTICDADGNGWVSFRECRDSLALDRAGFASFDTDGDYRIDFEEFGFNYVEVTRRVGVLPMPRSATEQAVDLPRGPTQLLAAYDRDGDGALQRSELMRLFDDYGRPDLSLDTAMANLDSNGDEGLGGSELERASRLLSSLYVAGRPTGEEEAPPTSIDELFGMASKRPSTIDSSPQPPLIVGPVLPFRRLDLNGDEGIDLEDLYALLSPATLEISIGAIHAALDLDENGVIDRRELAAGLGMRNP